MNMKKFAPIALAAVMLSLLITGCGNNAKTEAQTENAPETAAQTAIEQYKTEFVGDNSKVAHIAQLTEYPDGYAYDHIAIQSEEEPYGLTVYLKRGADASPDASFDACAETAFSLIGNLSELEYADAQTEEVIASFTR